MKKVDPMFIISQLAPMCSVAQGLAKSILQEVLNLLDAAPDVSENKFVLIKDTHINLDQIRSFAWINGELCIHYAGRHFFESWTDPDRKLYKNLCYRLGAMPTEDPEELT